MDHIILLVLLYTNIRHGFSQSNERYSEDAQSPLTKEYVLVDKPLSWAEAMVNCKRIGMELASIQTAEEDNYVMNLIKPLLPIKYYHGFWIGLTDYAKENDFMWIEDGSAVKFNRFAAVNDYGKPEPNNLYGEHCVMIYQFRNGHLLWNDSQCGNRHRSICSKNFMFEVPEYNSTPQGLKKL